MISDTYIDDDTNIELEVKMAPTAYLELPMSTSDSLNIFPIDLSLTLNEKLFSETDKFEKLEIKVSISNDDPRLKAIDIYTQFSGINTLMIKHAPHWIYPAGQIAYSFYPDWDDDLDRVIERGETVPTEFFYPVDYSVAKFLFAHSEIIEVSPHEKFEIGMARGNEDSNDGFGVLDHLDGVIVVDLGKEKTEFNKGGLEQKLYMDCKNPLCVRSFTFTDTHPIPFSIYNAFGYFNERLGISKAGDPVLLGYAIYEPSWLKVGKISERISGGTFYTYNIKCITSLKNMSFDLVRVENIFSKYQIGRWVLLAKVNNLSLEGKIARDESGKKKEDEWVILPSSGSYWKNAIEYFKKIPGI